MAEVGLTVASLFLSDGAVGKILNSFLLRSDCALHNLIYDLGRVAPVGALGGRVASLRARGGSNPLSLPCFPRVPFWNLTSFHSGVLGAHLSSRGSGSGEVRLFNDDSSFERRLVDS